ncbi:ferredoxin [Nocardia sp. 348MFTsu5.1]|uniref:ferredoxin n=1 Tax=Nocardia sp. 348MFTsu5.1 TaxID=1172185 RepID=UPI0003650F1D
MGKTMSTSRLKVDKARCEGHALCAQNAPDIFDIGDDDLAVWVEYPPEGTEKEVRAAIAACPRQAISLFEES